MDNFSPSFSLELHFSKISKEINKLALILACFLFFLTRKLLVLYVQ